MQKTASVKQKANAYKKSISSAEKKQKEYEKVLKMYQERVSTNPYRNTSVILPNGIAGYVNNLGYFQEYEDPDNTMGKNNCSAQPTLLNKSLDYLSNPLNMITAAGELKASGSPCMKTEGRNIVVSTDKKPSDNTGKIGYVDYNGDLYEYNNNDIIPKDVGGKLNGDDDLIQNFYEKPKFNMNVPGNNLLETPIDLKNAKRDDIAKFAQGCITNENCYGLVWDKNQDLGYYKSKSARNVTPVKKDGFMYAQRKIEIDNKKYGKDCSLNKEPLPVSSETWNATPYKGKMNPGICDKTRFLNQPAVKNIKQSYQQNIQEAEKDEEQIVESANNTLDDINEQQKSFDVNTIKNKRAYDAYIEITERKIPSSLNDTTNQTESFTSLSNDPSQRATTVKFKNINGLVTDTSLLVNQSYAKFVLWSIIGITAAVVTSKIVMRSKQ